MSEPQMIREPAWVTSAADQLAADLAARATPDMLGSFDVVMLLLREPPEGADPERWERCCDHCGTFVPQGRTFHAGLIAREVHGKQLLIGYGACETCLPMP